MTQFADRDAARCKQALHSMPDAIASLPRTTIPLLPAGLMGVESLRQVGEPPDAASEFNATSDDSLPQLDVGLSALIDEIC